MWKLCQKYLYFRMTFINVLTNHMFSRILDLWLLIFVSGFFYFSKYVLFHWYQKIVKLWKHVMFYFATIWLVNLLGALCGLGDLIAQTAIDKKSFDAVEWSRVGRFAFIGATLIVRDLFLVLLFNLLEINCSPKISLIFFWGWRLIFLALKTFPPMSLNFFKSRISW